MLAALLLAFLCGAGFHAVLVAVALGMWRDRNLFDIRPALNRRPYVPPASVGVRVVRSRPPMGEPANVPLRDVQAFDEEHTQ